jgi:hypothetical protein
MVYHNVMWGLHQGAYGGLAIGTNVTGLELVNNVILSINFTHLGSAFDAAKHHGEHNLFGLSQGQWQDDPSDLEASDPKFTGIPDIEGPKVDAPEPADFTPQATSPLRDAATTDAQYSLPGTDFFGAARDSMPNIGAIE